MNPEPAKPKAEGAVILWRSEVPEVARDFASEHWVRESTMHIAAACRKALES